MKYIVKAFKDKGIDQKDVMKDLGVSQPYASALMSGKTSIGKKTAKKLNKLYGFDILLLITDKEINEDIPYEHGSLHSPPQKEFYYALPPKGISDVIKVENRVSKTQFIGVPMYNIPASASLVEMYGDANDVKIVGHLTIPGATKDSFALPVHGHSMYPTLENGSWCVLRPLTDKTDIEWGEIYYIEYGDYRMYKRLLKADDEESVVLWSDNQSEIVNNKPKYAPKTIKKTSIKRLCLLTDILKKPNY